ncbi:LOW QUALITY PROTEIN: ACAT-related protein required for viability 1 [Leptinotarsa decemlineata]|uniref:LOW QUALITY PROTEIN: ACAT-related protein required for viability 1 n=1 Tax=Leptinotarsa decemlineata TaxID=7539 RepID=UPI003D30B733
MENGEIINKKYACINCGNYVKSLYKKYSANVLKLTECDYCRNVADKYVEYDTVIIIIDLILLRIIAYRHFLFNFKFKSYWKLSLVLLIIETYSNWIVTKGTSKFEVNDTKPYLQETYIYLDDFRFYKMSLILAIGTASFIILTYFLTKVHTYFYAREHIGFTSVFKAITLSSCGMFLLLPSLIWDISVHEYHMIFISLYTTLSQLIAHRALCSCEKMWSIIIIFSSYILKTYVTEYFGSYQLLSMIKII